MKALGEKILDWWAIIALLISFGLFTYMFVTEGDILESQIGRITALINGVGIAGILSLKKLVKKQWSRSMSLWVVAHIIFVVTIVQGLAVVKLHGVLARVVVSGEPKAVANSVPEVRFLDGTPKLTEAGKGNDTFLFRTKRRVLTWEQPKTVIAFEPLTQARDTGTLDWPLGSLWDVLGEQVVDLELKLERAEVKVHVTPEEATVSLLAYSGQDTTEYREFSGAQHVNLGEKIQIKAWHRGYDTIFEDLDSIRGDTTIELSLKRKLSDIIVEAYNIGGHEVRNAVVSINSKPTIHRAFEKFGLVWGKHHDIGLEFVIDSRDTLRSEARRITLKPDTLRHVECTLRFVD